MDEIKTKKFHTVKLEGMKHLEITAGVAIESFCETQIVVKLEEKSIVIVGEKLVVNKFNVDDGQVVVDGEIHSLKYCGHSKEKTNFIKKMFK